MDNGKTSMFYIVATILVMLSISLAMNGFFSADQVETFRQNVSTALSGYILPGAHAQSTLYDTYCTLHNQYYGLQF